MKRNENKEEIQSETTLPSSLRKLRLSFLLFARIIKLRSSRLKAYSSITVAYLLSPSSPLFLHSLLLIVLSKRGFTNLEGIPKLKVQSVSSQ